jgi:hypothetical protein
VDHLRVLAPTDTQDRSVPFHYSRDASVLRISLLSGAAHGWIQGTLVRKSVRFERPVFLLFHCPESESLRPLLAHSKHQYQHAIRRMLLSPNVMAGFHKSRMIDLRDRGVVVFKVDGMRIDQFF